MKRYVEELVGIENKLHLKHSLEEAEILKSGMKLVLINPSLDAKRRDQYKKDLSMLSSKIREIKNKI